MQSTSPLVSFLALAGLLPMAVFMISELIDARSVSIRKAFVNVWNNEAQKGSKAGGIKLIVLGILIGAGPDTLVLLDPDVPALVMADRLLDFCSAPVLISGFILYRASRAQYPRRWLLLWLGGLAAGCVLALLFVWAAS